MNILEKIGLQKLVVILLDMTQLDFYRKFKEAIDEDDSLNFDLEHGGTAWIDKPNERKYIGNCSFDGFKIRKSKPFRKEYSSYPIITGSIKQVEKGIEVSIKTSGLNWRSLTIFLGEYFGFNIFTYLIFSSVFPNFSTSIPVIICTLLVLISNIVSQIKAVDREAWEISVLLRKITQ